MVIKYQVFVQKGPFWCFNEHGFKKIFTHIFSINFAPCSAPPPPQLNHCSLEATLKKDAIATAIQHRVIDWHHNFLISLTTNMIQQRSS